MSSIGGLDPLADAYNLMGAQGLTDPNPYLEFTGQIPMAGYMGAPTDASGNPIASFTQAQQAHDAWNAANPAQPAPAKPPGTTLNSAQNLYNQLSSPSAMNPSGNPAFGMANWGFGLGAQGAVDMNSPQYQMDPSGDGSGRGGIPFQHATMPDGMPYGQTSLGRGVTGTSWQGPGGGMAQQAPQQSAPAAQQNPVDMRQAYLDALSNPGHMNTPGAVMQPGATPTGGPQPSVLAAFLAAHPQGGTAVQGKGGGGYSNVGFFNTLNQLQAQKGAGS